MACNGHVQLVPRDMSLMVEMLLVLAGVETNPGPKGENDDNLRYKKTKGAANIKGTNYEVKMLALLFLRAIKSEKNFHHIAGNLEAAGSFDDIVLKFEDESIFLQLKHKENIKKILTPNLLTLKGDFCLFKYYESYLQMKKNWEKDRDLQQYGKFENCSFIVFTNDRLQEKIGDEVTDISELLNMVNTRGKCTQFTSRENNEKIYELFDKLPDFTRLLSDAISSPDPQNACEELLKVVQILHDNNAKSIPEKSVLVKLLTSVKKVDDFSQYEEFCFRCFFFTEQKSEDELDRLIKEEMKVVCGTDAKYEKLLHEFRDWKENKSYRLTDKADFWINIVKSCAEEFIKKVENVEINFSEDECNIIKEKLLEKQKTCIQTSCIVLTCKKVSQSLKTEFIVSSRTIHERSNDVLAVWKLRAWNVLIVEGPIEDSQILLKIDGVLNTHSDKKLVIVTLDTNKQYDEFFTFTDNFNFNQLDLTSQERVKECKINFQGYHVKLNSMAVSVSQVSITANDVIELLSGKQKMGDELECPEEYYIPRTLVRRENVSSNILREKQSVIAVTGITETEELQQLLASNEVVEKYEPSRGYSESNFYFTINNATEFKELSKLYDNIHWLHKSDESFVWRSSKGNMSSLKEYLQPERVRYSGSEEVAKLDQPIILVVTQPGMGKSMELKHLGWELKRKNNLNCVVKVDLSTHHDFLNDDKITALELLLKAGKFDTDFQKNLFEHQLYCKGNVVVLLDGFDEISPKYSNRVFSLLKDILATKVKTTWVTSRHFMMEKLEAKLCTISFDMELFTTDEQIKFLFKFWRTPEKNYSILKTFVTELLQRTAKSLDDKLLKFTGNPLQTRMLAEVFECNAEKYCRTQCLSLPPTLDLLHLYKEFMEKKWEIYCSKMGVSLTNAMAFQMIKSHRKIFDENLMACALVVILDECELLNLCSVDKILERNKQFIDEYNDNGERTGIVVGISNERAIFLHQTFAEYFAALSFSKNYNFFKTQYFNNKFAVVRKFFDRILCEDCDLHRAVLNHDESLILELLSGKTCGVNDQDKGKRTALHLAIINFLDVSDSEDIDDNKSNGTCEKIVKILLDSGSDHNVKDEVLECTALQLADKIKAWPVIDMLLKKKTNKEDLVNLKKFKQDALKVASTRGFVELIQFMLDGEVEPEYRIDGGLVSVGNSFKYNLCSMLHLAASHGQLILVEFLLSKGANIDSLDSCKQTPLICAIENGDVAVSQFLLQKGADTSICDQNGRTPLILSAQKGLGKLVMLMKREANDGYQDSEGNTVYHFAAETHDVSIMTCLPRNRYQIDIENKKGETPLMRAAYCNNVEAVKMLCKLITKPDRFNPALLIAATKGHLDVVKHLWSRSSRTFFTNKDDDTVLHLAAKEGHVEIVKFLLLEQSTSPATCNKKGNTPVHVASSNGHCEVVDLLLKKDRSGLNARNERGNTPLHLAASKGHTEVVHLLLNFKANLGAVNNYEDTPLHKAVVNGHLDVTLVLLSQNADVKARNNFKNTPLHIAAEHGHQEITSHLLKYKADVNATNKSIDAPLHISTSFGHEGIVKLLLKYRANLNAQNKSEDTPLHIATEKNHKEIVKILLEHKAIVCEYNINSETPLHIAAKLGNNDVLDCLLKQSVKSIIYNKEGYMPEHLAVREGHLGTLQKLIQKGARIDSDDARKQTLLHIAVTKKYEHIVEWLIQQGAKCNIQDKKLRTPLHLAAGSGDLNIVTRLVNDGAADLETPNRHNFTSLHLAAQFGHATVVEFLLTKEANVEARNKQFCTPLHLAAQSGHASVVQVLLKDEANIDARDKQGSTPLHLAAQSGHASVVECLLNEGANETANNNSGQTPLLLAALNNHWDVIYILE